MEDQEEKNHDALSKGCVQGSTECTLMAEQDVAELTVSLGVRGGRSKIMVQANA